MHKMVLIQPGLIFLLIARGKGERTNINFHPREASACVILGLTGDLGPARNGRELSGSRG